jgi:hypothetical protein
LSTDVSPVIVQSVIPHRPIALHGRAPHALRDPRDVLPSHVAESQTSRAPSSAIADSVSGPAPPAAADFAETDGIPRSTWRRTLAAACRRGLALVPRRLSTGLVGVDARAAAACTPAV